jgi:predicted DNA-binding protein (MmcQ/YjbR family)
MDFYNIAAMPTQAAVQKFAMSLPGVIELPHFDKTSFRVSKKIFLTLNSKENRVCVKLNELDQSVFCADPSGSVYPVPNKYGKMGWTLISLKTVHPDLLKDAIKCAYNQVK